LIDSSGSAGQIPVRFVQNIVACAKQHMKLFGAKVNPCETKVIHCVVAVAGSQKVLHVAAVGNTGLGLEPFPTWNRILLAFPQKLKKISCKPFDQQSFSLNQSPNFQTTVGLPQNNQRLTARKCGIKHKTPQNKPILFHFFSSRLLKAKGKLISVFLCLTFAKQNIKCVF